MVADSPETREAVMEELEKVLKEEGCSVARVKEFNLDGKGYRDVKVSIKFANGGVRETIVVSDFMFRMKMGCGHVVHELQRTLEPFQSTDPATAEARERLQELAELLYTEGVSAADLERAYASASSSLQGLRLEWTNALLSSRDMSSVKSPVSGTNLAQQPQSDSSPATPNSSDILNGIIDKFRIALGEEISKKYIEENGKEPSMSVEDAEGRGMFGEKGVMAARNGVVVRPGVDISAAIEELQHATPYKFEEFSLDFTRKGDGALAYGYGIYLSENWEINKWYFEKLGDIIR